MLKEDFVKYEISKKIKRLSKGKAKDFREKEDLKDSFYNKLFLYDYEKDSAKKIKLIQKATDIAEILPELKGWPSNPKKFWDVESHGWQNKIHKELRELVSKELSQRIKKYFENYPKCVSLGSGSFQYVKGSVMVDFSKCMLESAPEESKRIVHDLNEIPWPFEENSFDAAIMAFILDYVDDPEKFMREALRICKEKGRIFIVQSKGPVQDLYQIQAKRHIGKCELKELLEGLEYSIKEKTIGKKTLVFAEAKL